MVVHGIMVNNSYADFVTQSRQLLKFTLKNVYVLFALPSQDPLDDRSELNPNGAVIYYSVDTLTKTLKVL